MRNFRKFVFGTTRFFFVLVSFSVEFYDNPAHVILPEVGVSRVGHAYVMMASTSPTVFEKSAFT